MKKTMKMLALLVCTTFMSFPLCAAAEGDFHVVSEDAAAETTVIPSSEAETLLIEPYDGYFDGLCGAPSHVYVGDTLDVDSWGLFLRCERPGDKPFQITLLENYLEDDGIPVRAEEYANCYTIDVSQVDLTKPGNYHVYVKTIPGEKALFHYRGDTNYRYEVTMQEHTFSYEICVSPIPLPEINLTLKDDVIFDNEETTVHLASTVSADLTGFQVTAEPEGIVEIGEFSMPDPDSPHDVPVPTASVKALKPGTVTIKAVTDSGLTASYHLIVRDHTHYLNGFYANAGQTWTTVFYSESGQQAFFSIADESIAKIVEVDSETRKNTQLVTIMMLSPGSTTLTAVTPDGRTETAVITALTTETVPVETETASQIGSTDLGDVNSDGSIDILDVIYLNRYLLGALESSECNSAIADVNRDGLLDSTDSLLILKYVVEIITDFN